MNKLFLAAGHTGARTGAKKYLDEGAETIRLRNDLKNELLKSGVHVVIDSDRASLSEVITSIKSRATFRDYVLDLHFNAGGGTGVEAFVNDNATEEENGMALGLCMCVCVSRVLGIKNRGVKKQGQSARGKLGIFGINANVVLLEVCFVDSKPDSDSYKFNYSELVKSLAEVIKKNMR